MVDLQIVASATQVDAVAVAVNTDASRHCHSQRERLPMKTLLFSGSKVKTLSLSSRSRRHPQVEAEDTVTLEVTYTFTLNNALSVNRLTNAHPLRVKMDSVQDALAQLGFPAQTERGRKMAIRGSEKHDERFQQAEAAKPQEQRLLNRQDLDEDARKIFVQTTLKHMRRTISSFVRFHTTTLGATTEEAMQYFRKGGPLPDRPLIRKYLIWFASGSQGRMELQTVEESATSIRRPPSMQSMITQYSSLNTCLRYFNQRPDMLLASDTRLWIKTDLSNELSLRKDMKAKPIALLGAVQDEMGEAPEAGTLGVQEDSGASLASKMGVRGLMPLAPTSSTY
ncbi:hypothetical protein V496_04784 [Pseudogymnoascus sp. VKM F-4515 (FW-2607)]|nr:hypothetical protein V496_04784 [Pseudogymnoascus sp. VKM F-4515 (FW-2607)]